MPLPLLAITMGDPAGVGPEVIVKALADPRIAQCCTPVVFGHPKVLDKAIALVGSELALVSITSPEDAAAHQSKSNTLCCVPVGEAALLEVPNGSVDARSGQAAYQAINQAVDAALAGTVGGIVTAPISKAALHAAGHTQYPGHTELLADRCGIDDFAMMLYLPPEEVPPCPAGLGVVHVTLHMALREVFGNLSTEAIAAKCALADRVMREGFGLPNPRVGVCALNPHAGEDGLFGDEEQRLIRPAC